MLSREARIGLTVLAAVVLVYLVASWANGSGLFRGARSTYYVRFADVSGLRLHDPVTLRGYEVGQVAAIDPGADALLVTLEVDPAVALRQDAVARILVKEILGGKVLALEAGTAPQVLPPGDTLAGLPVFDLSIAIERFGSLLDGLDAAQLRRVLANLDSVTGNVAALTGAVRPQAVAQTVRDLQQSASSLSRQVQAAEQRALVADADRLLTRLDSLAVQLHSTVARADTALAAIAPPAVATAEEARRLLTRLNATLDSLEGSRTVVGRLLYDPAFADQLNTTLQGINQTLQYIRSDSLSVGIRLFGRRRR